MPSRKEILEDIKANNIQLHKEEYYEVEDFPGAFGSKSKDITDEELKTMDYWELWRKWTQAKHTLNIVAGIIRA